MIDEWLFGTTPNGQGIDAYDVGDVGGLTATVLGYGATLQALRLPDGRNVVLSHATLNNLLEDETFIGAIIGRNANRIVDAKFEIDDKAYPLNPTDGDHNLHSGPNGFDKQVWDKSTEGEVLVLRHLSPDGDQGFPGEVDVTLRISVKGMTLRLEMEARTTRATPVNMTWHPYWNLAGAGRIDGHDLLIGSDHITKLDSRDPTPVKDTRFDFQRQMPLGSIQLDENYVNAANVRVSHGNTSLTITSSLPDIQVYTGDHLSVPRTGIAVEPQFRPNDINIDQACLLQPGETYGHWIEYRFEAT